MNTQQQYKDLDGPILIIGASGFVGANLLRQALQVRSDVVGTMFSGNAWRLIDISATNIAYINLQDDFSVQSLIHRVRPRTIFDCSSFGAYPFEKDLERIHETNYLSLIRLLDTLSEQNISAYIHAGSSSEYGLNSHAPKEDDRLVPNSHYAVSKAAASQAITYYGKIRQLPIINLRLYSVYGPYEDSSRLIPVLCERSLHNMLPTFASPRVSRDFIHVNDVCAAFAAAALRMQPSLYGESYNIGTGICTTLADLSELTKNIFQINNEATFNKIKGRSWDLDECQWHADPAKAKAAFGWEAEITLAEGLSQTRDWWENRLQSADFRKLTKNNENSIVRRSLTAIVACYKDEPAIPVMYKRLISVFQKNKMDYEIIFVNDGSPDNSAEVIREISSTDPNVVGITHSRNFGSQAAFRSGMEIASKQACVLLDGDLQDPPELISEFIKKWQDGADVVYGRRVKREMPISLEILYRSFYRLFAAISEIPVPKDAGDFSLLDRTVVWWMLQCHERDVFLRGLRAYVGFKQVAVDYKRPERMFGVSTNNLIKNIGWAKKGIFSFSRMPLHLLTFIGSATVLFTILLAVACVVIRFVSPTTAPRGITFLSLLVMFFGSFIILGIGLLGEYIGKIFEETKARPPFIRSQIILRGVIKAAPIQGSYKS